MMKALFVAGLVCREFDLTAAPDLGAAGLEVRSVTVDPFTDSVAVRLVASRSAAAVEAVTDALSLAGCHPPARNTGGGAVAASIAGIAVVVLFARP